MPYIALHTSLKPNNPEFSEILFALFDNNGFEGITEADGDYIAYINTDQFRRESVDEIVSSLEEIGCVATIIIEKVKDQNWNHLWESNFEPVTISGKCVIRAPFHEAFNDFPYRITIEPKMSFGTGHHQTTRLMIEQMMQMDITNLSVLDMGCGTGVLGILASMLGARSITCIDNDQWAYENTLENISKNSINNIKVILGGKEEIPKEKFDIILANINRNILIDMMPQFLHHSSDTGKLMLSGILTDDSSIIQSTARVHEYNLVNTSKLDQWIMMLFERI